jgi:hypothetical protein
MAGLSAAASVAAVVTLGAGWFLGSGGSAGGGAGEPTVVPASQTFQLEHAATTAQFMLPDAQPLTPLVTAGAAPVVAKSP